MKTINRKKIINQINQALKIHRIVGLIGPRQVGKTFIAKEIIKKTKKNDLHFFDLEDPTDFDLLKNVKLILGPLEGTIVIDEIQHRPEIFKYLRVKSDQMKKSSRIIILGSSSRDLLEQSGESLAGRIAYIEITGFSISEIENTNKSFLRGTFPLSYLAKSDAESFIWRKNYVQSYFERDLKALGIDLPPQALRRFLQMLTGYHGQIFNSSELGKSLGFSHTTARKYLDILSSAFIIRELKPWKESIIQRQVKQPKIYFRDAGLVNYLMGIKTREELFKNPKLGSLWEGFALEETIKLIDADCEDLYFWALHQNGELDLLWKNFNQIIGFEFKFSDAPSVTSSMQKAVEFLKLDHLYVIYPGEKKSALTDKITLLPFGMPLPKI